MEHPIAKNMNKIKDHSLKVGEGVKENDFTKINKHAKLVIENAGELQKEAGILHNKLKPHATKIKNHANNVKFHATNLHGTVMDGLNDPTKFDVNKFQKNASDLKNAVQDAHAAVKDAHKDLTTLPKQRGGKKLRTRRSRTRRSRTRRSRTRRSRTRRSKRK